MNHNNNSNTSPGILTQDEFLFGVYETPSMVMESASHREDRSGRNSRIAQMPMVAEQIGGLLSPSLTIAKLEDDVSLLGRELTQVTEEKLKLEDEKSKLEEMVAEMKKEKVEKSELEESRLVEESVEIKKDLEVLEQRLEAAKKECTELKLSKRLVETENGQLTKKMKLMKAQADALEVKNRRLVSSKSLMEQNYQALKNADAEPVKQKNRLEQRVKTLETRNESLKEELEDQRTYRRKEVRRLERALEEEKASRRAPVKIKEETEIDQVVFEATLENNKVLEARLSDAHQRIRMLEGVNRHMAKVNLDLKVENEKVKVLESALKTTREKSRGLKKELTDAQDSKNRIEGESAVLKMEREEHRAQFEKELEQAKKFQESLTTELRENDLLIADFNLKLVQERTRADAEIQKCLEWLDGEKRQMDEERMLLQKQKEKVDENKEKLKKAHERLTVRAQQVSKSETKRATVKLNKEREEFEKMKREFLAKHPKMEQDLVVEKSAVQAIGGHHQRVKEEVPIENIGVEEKKIQIRQEPQDRKRKAEDSEKKKEPKKEKKEKEVITID